MSETPAINDKYDEASLELNKRLRDAYLFAVANKITYERIFIMYSFYAKVVLDEVKDTMIASFEAGETLDE